MSSRTDSCQHAQHSPALTLLDLIPDEQKAEKGEIEGRGVKDPAQVQDVGVTKCLRVACLCTDHNYKVYTVLTVSEKLQCAT